eukprot:831750-Rhodomonas_salina.1
MQNQISPRGGKKLAACAATAESTSRNVCFSQQKPDSRLPSLWPIHRNLCGLRFYWGKIHACVDKCRTGRALQLHSVHGGGALKGDEDFLLADSYF